MFKYILKCDPAKVSKNNYTWNIIASFVNASESVILVASASRILDIDSAGVMTLALAISTLLLNVGKYSIRGYQTTDVKERFSYDSYYSFRIMTVALMIISCICYLLYKVLCGEFNTYKALIVFLLCLIYAIEAMEDVFLGQYQSINRLDVASKVFTFRWIAIILIFCISLLFLRNMVLSLLLSVVFSFVLDILLIHDANIVTKNKKAHFHTKQVLDLAKQCFPLFASTFLFFFITTAPKLSIDRYLTAKDQACYGVIAMPILVIDLLSNFLYQPQLVEMAQEWKENRIKSLIKRIRIQILYISLITCFGIICAYTFGCALFSKLFSIDVMAYRCEFSILLLASGIFALLSYASMILAIIRKHLIHFIGMFIISILSIIGFNPITYNYGISGIVVYYLALVSISALINLSALIVLIHRNNKKTWHSPIT